MTRIFIPLFFPTLARGNNATIYTWHTMLSKTFLRELSFIESFSDKVFPNPKSYLFVFDFNSGFQKKSST